MKERTLANLEQAAVVLRLASGASVLLNVFGFTGLLLRAADSHTLAFYQLLGTLLSIALFTLTFEPHFADYWDIEATLFFCFSLLIWGEIGLTIDNGRLLFVLVVALPILTVLLPWHWQFQLGICSLCIGFAVLAHWIRPDLAEHDLFLMAAGESAVAILASVQLERQRKERNLYIAALAADEEQFRALIENSPDGITVLNATGTIVFESPSVGRLLGHVEKLSGRNVYEFLQQDDGPKFRALLSECMNFPDRSLAMLVRCRHADGSWRTIEGMCRQLQNYGSESLVVLNWRDVTERVAQEEHIRESEEKFRRIFQYSTNAISLVSRTDGTYIDVNDEWLRTFGYNRAEVIGRDPLSLGRWVEPEDYLRFATELLMKGGIRNRPTMFRVNDGSIVRGLLSTVLLETNGKSVALSLISFPPTADPGPD
jgi:PAS domain S-box-containing protein